MPVSNVQTISLDFNADKKLSNMFDATADPGPLSNILVEDPNLNEDSATGTAIEPSAATPSGPADYGEPRSAMAYEENKSGSVPPFNTSSHQVAKSVDMHKNGEPSLMTPAKDLSSTAQTRKYLKPAQ